MFPLEKKDEPEDESKGETKDEPIAEPDKVIITDKTIQQTVSLDGLFVFLSVSREQ